jgi:glucose dehydrogenase
MARRIIGIVIALVGLVWIGQGLGAIKGSFMTGSAFWAVMGFICLLFAFVLLRPRRSA